MPLKSDTQVFALVKAGQRTSEENFEIVKNK